MLLDTDVLIDFLRGHPPAVAWLTTYDSPIGVPGLVAMELIQGCRNLAEQQRIDRELQRFPMHWPTPADCRRAYRDFASFRLSHGLGLLDALIASTAIGLGEPLASFNVKHYRVIPGLTIVQPY
ncbi:type II toxin-antitoxin system VapC family toxin [Tautonia sp. JC769]|uniref:type II toxin-antitoxin system VapC family toxin n=1 Tax=Tautonia sp. JC769 TaxID=3232135 RepID=UPI003458351C